MATFIVIAVFAGGFLAFHFTYQHRVKTGKTKPVQATADYFGTDARL